MRSRLNFVSLLMFQPQNLVLTGEFPECDVKLCDFGISRYINHGADIREIMGTPDYVGEFLSRICVYVCVYSSRRDYYSNKRAKFYGDTRIHVMLVRRDYVTKAERTFPLIR